MTAKAKFKISDEVRDVLAAAGIDEHKAWDKTWPNTWSVKFTQQLDRKLYLEVNKVLEGAGGKWNRKAGVHLFPSDPRVLLGLAAETGVATNLKQLHQSFYTPADVADQMVELASMSRHDPLLEPSAGEGALLDAVARAEKLGEYLAFENDARAADFLMQKGYSVLFEDFLESDFYALPEYSRVLMNPPFAKNAAVNHISQALRYLTSGGRLVSVIPRGMMEKESKPVLKLIAQIAELSLSATYEVIDLPDATFKKAGTLVRTSLLVVKS